MVEHLLCIFNHTVTTAIHLTHQHLHAGVTGFCFLKGVLEPPSWALQHYLPQRNPAVHRRILLHYLYSLLLSLRLNNPNPLRFGGFRRRHNPGLVRNKFRASFGLLLDPIGCYNPGEILKPWWRWNRFSHKRKIRNWLQRICFPIFQSRFCKWVSWTLSDKLLPFPYSFCYLRSMAG